MIAVALPPQQIAIEYVITTPMKKNPDYVDSFENIIKQMGTAQIPSIKNQIASLSECKYGMDKDDVIGISDVIVANTYKFIEAVNKDMCLGHLTKDDVYATPYGSIVMDFKSNNGMVSVEIGKDKIGFFTDFKKGPNTYSDGVKSSFKIVPKRLLFNLAKL